MSTVPQDTIVRFVMFLSAKQTSILVYETDVGCNKLFVARIETFAKIRQNEAQSDYLK